MYMEYNREDPDAPFDGKIKMDRRNETFEQEFYDGPSNSMLRNNHADPKDTFPRIRRGTKTRHRGFELSTTVTPHLAQMLGDVRSYLELQA